MKQAIRALGRSAKFPQTNSLQHCRLYASTADLRFGQPLHETHPHLLQPGELTPGITALEYAERRAKLAHALPPNSIAIIASADLKYRSGAVFYKFHQDPDFLYLTGFNEQDSLAIIEKSGNGGEHNFHLYVRPKDPKLEKWDGSRSGLQAAQDVFNADETGDVRNVVKIVSKIIGSAKEIYTNIPMKNEGSWNFQRIIYGPSDSRPDNLRAVMEKNGSIRSLRPLINELRVFKSDAEVKNLRKAGQVSGRVFTEAMKQHWKTEKALETFIEHGFRTNGCEESAYVPVVAGGENANQIHYVRNDDLLHDDHLVAVDAGGEFGGYITDITRTWPVSGKFTGPQKDLYEMVLAVQRTCVSLCRQDSHMSLDDLHHIAANQLQEGLKQLGFDLSKGGFETLFPHHLGHYIGLSVHDAPGYSRTSKLKKGQCITIEPGVYVDDMEQWPLHFRGMGIRIEDSVCVMEENPLNLTVEAVKEVVDIEALRQ